MLLQSKCQVWILKTLFAERKEHRGVKNDASTDDDFEKEMRKKINSIDVPKVSEERIGFVEYMLRNTCGEDDSEFLSTPSLLSEDGELKTKEIRDHAENIAGPRRILDSAVEEQDMEG